MSLTESGFAVGSLVRARGREWVVLPESSDEIVMVRPLGGTQAEVTGILTALETVEPATFAPPTVDDLGDYRSARLLRDALRMGIRSSAGPFRSFGEISVEPRPYQLVPLLMALKLETVRLLIADDVGIGKTVEAALIAKELLSTGDATGLAVLCPPHLAEQWQRELADKFHLDAELVLASTAARLERNLPMGRSIFEEHPITVVSLDFIKADRHRDDFLRACPNLVIVDEAHTCADSTDGRGSRHQRHRLLQGLASDPERHVVLVTATPHSGKVAAFRSLLGLLDQSFAEMGDNPSEAERRQLARHLVQRRRVDIAKFLGETPFPERERIVETYALSPAYASLFNDVLSFARETVRDGSNQTRQRVRWWSALSLLRALASSPAAAAATLRTRAANAAASTAEEADEIGRLLVLDVFDEEADAEQADTISGGDAFSEDEVGGNEMSRSLQAFADRADALCGDDDAKVVRVAKRVKQLIADGFQPIVFCRFIDTATYLADELTERLPNSVTVASVTGLLPPSEREQRVEALIEAPKRVLVATDCLSEGINLQHGFTAVVHYDLPWNPTRLEQREGRVDRFGQVADTVRVVTCVGKHIVDRTIEEVLIAKHLQIRKALGVSVPVPATSGEVLEVLAERLLAAESVEQEVDQLTLELPGIVSEFNEQWTADAESERQSRTRYAQHAISVEEVAAELQAARGALGDATSLATFVRTAVEAHDGLAVEEGTAAHARIRIELSETPAVLRDRLSMTAPERFMAEFDLPAAEDSLLLGRTHPFVATLAGFVVDTALDAKLGSVASRAGVTRTDAVQRRTTLVLTRFRYQLVSRRKGRPDHPMLAEEAVVLAFTGEPANPVWLPAEDVEALLAARPSGSVITDIARDFITETLDQLGDWRVQLDQEATSRARRLAESHGRVREQARMSGSIGVTPSLPVDVLGVYVLLPGITS
jgi:superfamily II DNA or RNA helicase